MEGLRFPLCRGSSVAAVRCRTVAAFVFFRLSDLPVTPNVTAEPRLPAAAPSGQGDTLSPDKKLGFKHQKANRCQKRQSHREQEREAMQIWGLGLSNHTRYCNSSLSGPKCPKFPSNSTFGNRGFLCAASLSRLCTRHTDKTWSYTGNVRQRAGSFPGSAALFCG